MKYSTNTNAAELSKLDRRRPLRGISTPFRLNGVAITPLAFNDESCTMKKQRLNARTRSYRVSGARLREAAETSWSILLYHVRAIHVRAIVGQLSVKA